MVCPILYIIMNIEHVEKRKVQQVGIVFMMKQSNIQNFFFYERWINIQGNGRAHVYSKQCISRDKK